MSDSAGIESLSAGECLRLLSSVPVGRVVFTDQALPAVVPVNFLLHKGKVVFRAGPEDKLAEVVRNAVVAFEVDEFDTVTWAGWSVTVVGRACVADDATELAELSSLGLRAWVPGPDGSFVVIEPEILDGRLCGALRFAHL